MNKWLTAIAFSVLLLVPLGTQNVSAHHPNELACPGMVDVYGDLYPGILVSENSVEGSNSGWYITGFGNNDSFCFIPIENAHCNAPYSESPIYGDESRGRGENFNGFEYCVALPFSVPHITLAEQCQGTSMLVDNHCFAQALNSMVGGAWFDIDTVSLIVGAIGVNPVISGLFAITIGGVAAQAVWFVHRRKKNMNKIIPLFALSVLLLAPVGVQESFADHPDELGCPDFNYFGDLYPGILVSGDDVGFFYEEHVTLDLTFCFVFFPGGGAAECITGPWIGPAFIEDRAGGEANARGCSTDPIPVPHITLAEQCQGAAVLIDNHCFAQALSSMIGGELLEINTIPLLVGAIGVNPVITGLVGITLAGIVGQTAWFVHRRKKRV